MLVSVELANGSAITLLGVPPKCRSRRMQLMQASAAISSLASGDYRTLWSRAFASAPIRRETMMGIILLAVLVVVLFGAGFAVHLLWIAAVVLAVVWVASFALSRGSGASRGSLRR